MAKRKPHRLGSGLNRAGSGVVIHGIPQLEEALDKLTKKMRDRVVDKATRDAANVVMIEAKRLCPVKTGSLRRSIHVKKGHATAAVSRQLKYSQKARDIAKMSYAVIAGEGFFKAETWYGGIVEFGSVNWDGKPFMRPAAKAKKEVIRQIYRKAIREVVQNSARRRANAAITALDFGVE